jgi:hypothetical protein
MHSDRGHKTEDTITPEQLKMKAGTPISYGHNRNTLPPFLVCHFTYINRRTHVCGFLTTFGKIHAYLL